MATVNQWLLRLLVAVLMLGEAASSAARAGNSSACPLDLGYAKTFPWDRTPCAPPVSNQTACCTTLLSVLGIGLAAHLRDTGLFRLPSAPASVACLRAFSDALASPPLSLPRSLVPACFPAPSQFAISPSAVVGESSIYMPNGSLDRYIFRDAGEGGAMPWAQRRSAVLDVAKGLEYMHHGVKPGIFHRDIKATNILLDADMRVRLADFGLARRSQEGQSHLTTRVVGTHGYLSPEYALYGQLTERSDVYSFGVLLLEVMSGRRALDLLDPSGVVLITDWAWTLVKAGRTTEVLAEALREGDGPSVAAMERFVLVGILCAHVTVACRPTMPEALRMLEGDVDVPELPDRPQPYGQRIAFDEGECNFSASSVLSGPFVDFGEMLR